MTWVEYHGGPWDSAMEDKPEPFSFVVVYRPREELPDGRYRIGLARGIYRREGPVMEGLDVIRMQWHEGVPEDLRIMEGRVVGPRTWKEPS
jgi:hypothetical protein